MLFQSLLAYFHFISIFTLVSTVVAELVLFNRTCSSKTLKLLGRIDSLYGLASILVLGSGFLRVYLTGKGWQYYFSNHIFLTKLGLFIIVGLLSIKPTVTFIKLRKEKVSEDGYTFEENKYKSIRKIIIIELILLALIPFLATLMSRGIG